MASEMAASSACFLFGRYISYLYLITVISDVGVYDELKPKLKSQNRTTIASRCMCQVAGFISYEQNGPGLHKSKLFTKHFKFRIQSWSSVSTSFQH